MSARIDVSIWRWIGVRSSRWISIRNAELVLKLVLDSTTVLDLTKGTDSRQG
jgi:hypothetical protein